MHIRSKLLGAVFGATLGFTGFMGDASAVLVVSGGPVNSTVFGAAGLDGTWTYVSPEIFGAGGNGYFPNGGVAEFELRLASYQHAFGTATIGHGGRTAIFDTTVLGDVPGATKSFAAPVNPYLFYFETLPCGGLIGCLNDDGRVYSDDFRDNDALNQLNMAIYQQVGTFAFFFDDAGPALGDDNDYNDMVVTVSAVPEPATLALLGASLLGLGAIRRRKVA